MAKDKLTTNLAKAKAAALLDSLAWSRAEQLVKEENWVVALARIQELDDAARSVSRSLQLLAGKVNKRHWSPLFSSQLADQEAKAPRVQGE